VVLHPPGLLRVAILPRASNTLASTIWAARFIRRADHRAFRLGIMGQKRRLHLRPGQYCSPAEMFMSSGAGGEVEETRFVPGNGMESPVRFTASRT